MPWVSCALVCIELEKGEVVLVNVYSGCAVRLLGLQDEASLGPAGITVASEELGPGGFSCFHAPVGRTVCAGGQAVGQSGTFLLCQGVLGAFASEFHGCPTSLCCSPPCGQAGRFIGSLPTSDLPSGLKPALKTGLGSK